MRDKAVDVKGTGGAMTHGTNGCGMITVADEATWGRLLRLECRRMLPLLL